MDINMTRLPKYTMLKLAGIALCALPFMSSSVMAEEFLCDATQSSTQELPLLDTSCPIGNGLWGKQRPKGQQSNFWIQCGLLAEPLALEQAKPIYARISTDVWMKKEGKDYRCLIGPYTDFSQAKRDLSQVKQLTTYKDAFIREVIKGAKHSVSPGASMPQSAAPQSAPQRSEVKNTAVSHSSLNERQEATKAEKTAQKQVTSVFAPSKKVETALTPVEPVKPEKRTTQVAIRVQTLLSDTRYQVPYMLSSDEQFYMENGLPWNRLSYDGAASLCNGLGMTLPSQQQWERLLKSKVMTENDWPVHLPYWGKDRLGLFTSGKVNQLKGTSLLNVMCVNSGSAS